MGQIFNTDLYFWDWDPLDKGCHLTAQELMANGQKKRERQISFGQKFRVVGWELWGVEGGS